jgi:hypothetical protein
MAGVISAFLPDAKAGERRVLLAQRIDRNISKYRFSLCLRVTATYPNLKCKFVVGNGGETLGSRPT